MIVFFYLLRFLFIKLVRFIVCSFLDDFGVFEEDDVKFRLIFLFCIIVVDK